MGTKECKGAQESNSTFLKSKKNQIKTDLFWKIIENLFKTLHFYGLKFEIISLVNFAIQSSIWLYSRKKRVNEFEVDTDIINIFSEDFWYFKASKILKTIYDTLKSRK